MFRKSTILLLVALAIATFPPFISTAGSDRPHDTSIFSPEIGIMKHNAQEISLRFIFKNRMIADICEYELDWDSRFSRLVAIPPGVTVKLDFSVIDSIISDGIDFPVLVNIPSPNQIVEISEPIHIRNLRFIRLTISPFNYDSLTRELSFYTNILVNLRLETKSANHSLMKSPKKVPHTLYNYLQQKTVNFTCMEWELDQSPGSLLIIAPNNTTILNLLTPLIEWKKRKGFPVTLANLTQTGSTAQQIKTYIQNAYNNWEPQLEYLILIGDCAGAVAVPASNLWGDHNYSRLDGDDILADIAVGRFSCANTTQLQTEIAKVLMYESNPYMGQTNWYKRAAVTAPSVESGISTVQTKRGIRYKAMQNGYTSVDTLWYGMAGSLSTFTTNNINSGIGFYNFRGFIGMTGFGNSNINALVNYFKLPFVVTITCQTGDITSAESEIVEEFFRVGTPNSPTGAIAAIGTATEATHTRHNNCLDNGIFGAIFDYDIFQFGDALNIGKYDLYLNYPDNPSSVEDFSNWNNLIGDPSCQIWTDIPQKMMVEYNDTIPLGSTSFQIEVCDSTTGGPLEGVQICLYNGQMQLVKVSDEAGSAFFTLPLSLDTTFAVTCCKHNYRPHLGNVAVLAQPVYISYQTLIIENDTLGVSLGISLKNYGDSITATGISATLSSLSGLSTILDSIEAYPPLAPFAISDTIFGFTIAISSMVSNQYELPLNLRVSSEQGIWDSYLPIIVSAPDLVYQNFTVVDANGQLDPGDAVAVEIEIINIGAVSAEVISGELLCENPFITIGQSFGAYGTLAIGQSSNCDEFTVNISPITVPGEIAHFTFILHSQTGFSDTTEFQAVIGTIVATDPTGPDEYGYYAVDNTDIEYSGCPDYNWVEIDHSVPGYQFNGQIINLSDYGYQQDDTELLNLPFEFVYYGQTFNQISVCSNGWMAIGDMTYFTNFRNWYIPSTLGPYSLIAPFWDDLYLQSNPPKKVYYYYDEPNHRYIVEWNVINYAPTNPLEKFQVILFDPEFYPTVSGDGEILFQYQDVANVFSQTSDNHFSTVGIKSPDDLMGLQYTYWNHYSPGAAVLADFRAIKFTTTVPVNLLPLLIENLTIAISGDSIFLDWEDLPEAQWYHIYRSMIPYFNVTGIAPIDSVQVSEYIDDTVPAGSQFYYRVTWE